MSKLTKIELANALLANTSHFICLLDRQGRYLFVNRVISGQPVDGLIGRPLIEHLEPEYHDIFLRRLACVFEKGESGSYEMKVRGPEGQAAWYENRLAPFRVGGKIKAAIVTSMEITGLVCSREEVSVSQKRYQDIFRSSRDAISYVSLDGMLLDVNPAYEALLGYAREELISRKRFRDVTPKEYHAADRARMEALRKTGQTVEFEKEYLRKDGTRVPVQITIFLVKNAEGGPAAFGAIIRDMTERQSLERRVIESAEAERARLGRDLHDSLGQSLTGVAFLAEALNGALKKRGGREASHAQQVSQLASEAVQQAKMLAQGLVPTGLETEGLPGALRLFCASVKKVLGVRCSFRSSGPTVMLDRSACIHLYRIAQEAVHNAARHGKAKNISVSLRGGGGRLVLSVLDDGVGIDLSSKKGLGLLIMRDRARLLGGDIEIKRRGRRGTSVVCSAF